MDPVFNPRVMFVTDAYKQDVDDQIAAMGGLDGMEGIQASLKDAITKVMDVTDMEESEAYKSGQFGNLLTDETVVSLEVGKEPSMTGPIKTATSVADALKFQYYEESDDKAAAFGHDLSFEDWKEMHKIVDTYTEILFGTPLLAIQEANPLLKELRSELSCPYRKFTFLCGHDSNITSVLSALGVEDYELPETVEPLTPIGVKLVFERWLDAEGDAFYNVSLVYASLEQLRNYERLTLDNPPMKVQLRFEGVYTDEHGMIPEEDLFAHLSSSINAYDSLREAYNVDAEGWENVEVLPAA
jgi:glucose-1-phosphatase